MTQNKILVFDPDTNVRVECEKKLSSEGYQVMTAADIEEALQCLKFYSIDLVVLELGFNDGSGLDYLYDIMNEDRNVKVLINSDYPEYKNDFHTWTADAFLAKSAGFEALKRSIERLLLEKSNRKFEVDKFS